MEPPEAWLEWDLNDVTEIKNKCIKPELNQIEKPSWIKSEIVSQIKLEARIQINLERVSRIKS